MSFTGYMVLKQMDFDSKAGRGCDLDVFVRHNGQVAVGFCCRPEPQGNSCAADICGHRSVHTSVPFPALSDQPEREIGSSRDAVARPETQQPKGYALQRSRRALVIDTDDAARQHLCDELAALGYLTEAVISVFDGLQMAREQRPDFVLIGVDDEPVESYNAASVIKREAGERFVPVVFLTTARDPDVFERCIASGGDDLLQKPLDSVVFRAKMRSLERIRSLHSELLAQKTTLDAHQEQQQREFEITERIFSKFRTVASNGRCSTSLALCV